MISIEKIFYQLSYCLILLIITSCSEPNRLNSMLDKCPTLYQLSDFNEIEKYYSGFVNSNSQYIAFKELSLNGYKLVSLVNTDGHYILSISLPYKPDRTVFKKIDAEAGQKIFNQIDGKTLLDDDNGDDVHTNCVITGIKKPSITSYNGLYNPSMFIRSYRKGNDRTLPELSKTIVQYVHHENSSLRIYAILTKLLQDQLPNYMDRINSLDKSKKVTIDGMVFTKDDHIYATEEESKPFRKKLANNPFFEITP